MRRHTPITAEGLQYRLDKRAERREEALAKDLIKTEQDLQFMLAQVAPHQRDAVELLWREQCQLPDPLLSQSPPPPQES